jgi:hypothetical protein
MAFRKQYSDRERAGGHIEHQRAAEALRKLRAEGRRKADRPFRAASLAEAEQVAEFVAQDRTPSGVLRTQALTGKHRAKATARIRRDDID